MWARSPSYRYAPFFMALLTNISLFSTLMDALYSDSQAKVRAWASHFSKYWFPVLMTRVIRRMASEKKPGAETDAQGEAAVALIDRLLSMLQALDPATPKPYEAGIGRVDGAFLNESGDDDDLMSGPQVHWEAVPSQWGEPAPNPRALAEKSPNFPRLRWMDLLQRQRILLSNPAWGGAQYEGWWRDADIRPERLDDIARALQPRPRPQALPDPKSDDPLPPESAPEKRILTISDRDHRVLKQLQNDLQSREPRRVADDSRHPP